MFTIARLSLVILAAAVILSSVAEAKTCSTLTVSGTYGFLVTGTNASALSAASLGQVTATPGSPGTLAGTLTASAGGVITTFAVKGNYQIAANCTGSATLFGHGTTTHYRLVAAANGAQVEIVNSDAGEIQSGYALAQGSATCTDAGVQGAFAFRNTGSVVGVGDIAFDGNLTFNGAGGAGGTEWGSEVGTIVSGVPLAGSYKINSDCTGTGRLTPMGGAATHFNFVVVNSGATVLAIETDTNTVVTGSLSLEL